MTDFEYPLKILTVGGMPYILTKNDKLKQIKI